MAVSAVDMGLSRVFFPPSTLIPLTLVVDGRLRGQDVTERGWTRRSNPAFAHRHVDWARKMYSAAMELLTRRKPGIPEMGIIEDIKGRIEHLSEAEHAELRAWSVERDHQLWDEQIACDLAAGKFAFEP